MKHILIMLLLLTGIASQASHAEDQPADSSDTSTQPADTKQGSGGDSAVPEKDKKAEDEEEPDCE